MNFLSYYLWGEDYETQQRELELQRKAKQEQVLKAYSLFLWLFLFVAVFWIKYQITHLFAYISHFVGDLYTVYTASGTHLVQTN